MTVDELIDGWEAAWSGKDAGAFEPLCAPGVHYEDPLTGEPLEGVDAVARHAERLWAAFPDARLERTGARLTDERQTDSQNPGKPKPSGHTSNV